MYSIATLAAEVVLSTVHVLRTSNRSSASPRTNTFCADACTPPRLREPSGAIATVTLEGGFEDFSTFNRRFRRASGLTGSTFRAQ